MLDEDKKGALFEAIAVMGKALASPRRLEMLDLLAQGARTVEELARASRQSETPAPIPPWIILGCDMIIQPTMTVHESERLRLKQDLRKQMQTKSHPADFPTETIAALR